MTFKGILEEWWKSIKAFSTAGWKAIRNLFSTSFHLIKEPVVILVKAFSAWIKAIAIGMYEILKSFVIDFVTSTVKMIWRSLVCLDNWIKAKFKKKEEEVKKNKK